MVLLRLKEGCPQAILPGGTSSRKLLAVMPVVCKFHPKKNNWVGITLIIKVENNLPIYLHLTYFFHWISNCRSNLESDACWAKVKDFWFKHPVYDPRLPHPLPPPPPHTHIHTHKKGWYLFSVKFSSSLTGIYPRNFDFR